MLIKVSVTNHFYARFRIPADSRRNAAKALVDVGGATEVYACATHGVLSGPALERIKDSVIKRVVLLDTIECPEEKQLDKITYLPVAPIFADAIKRIYADEPMSSLFV